MKTTLLFSALLLPLSVAAQTVSSPNGAISVSFSLADGGRPTYEMTYKGRPVVKPSHLGLELAKDKHATKGFAETSLMDGFTESHRGLLLRRDLEARLGRDGHYPQPLQRTPRQSLPGPHRTPDEHPLPRL